MYALPPLQGDCDERDIDGGCDSSIGPDLDGAFDSGLPVDKSTKAAACILYVYTHQSSRDARITNQEICVRPT